MTIERIKGSTWKIQDILKIGRLYKSRSEFALKNKPAYEAARVKGLLQGLYDSKLICWDEESIKSESLKFGSRTEMARGNGSAYNAARRLGLIDKLFKHKLKIWSLCDIEELASSCTHKKDMKRKSATAYNAALRMGIIDNLFDNLKRVRERDCVYLWGVEGQPSVYKVGITSGSMGIYRINQVAKEAGVIPKLIMLHKVGYENAKAIEREMKRMGIPYKFKDKFFGFSEFRYLTNTEVEKCINLAISACKS